MTNPYVDPQSIHNPATGLKPPASWGDTVRDDLEFLIAPPSVHAHRSAAQSIATATATAVQFSSVDVWDTDAFHDPASNNTRLTVPAGLAGRYVLFGTTTFSANTTGRRFIALRRNGVETEWGTSHEPNNALHRVPVAGEVELSVGDYMELWVYQDSGASRDVTASHLTMRWVSR